VGQKKVKILKTQKVKLVETADLGGFSYGWGKERLWNFWGGGKRKPWNLGLKAARKHTAHGGMANWGGK